MEVKDRVIAITVGEILQEDLFIPHFQRGYSWTEDMALQLLEDIQEAKENYQKNQTRYVLGTVILLKNKEELQIIDGQQRLTTLLLLKTILQSEQKEISFRTDSKNPPNLLQLVWNRFLNRCNKLNKSEREILLGYILDCCEMIRIQTDDPDEAFRIFDSQNYRGKSLQPHDLLKAYHLREISPLGAMESESLDVKKKIVQKWEKVSETELEGLFANYLWRIHCWSRGNNAVSFTEQHIDAFKGISEKQNFPFAKYHRSAHTKELIDSNSHESFQLDAPISAGKRFFEFVTFYLDELEKLKKEGFPANWLPYASFDETLNEKSKKVRYRYITELYLSVILYYKNKFGDQNFEEVKTILFKWAYSLRVYHERVQFVSVNNHALGKGETLSPFILLRNAYKSSEINKIKPLAFEQKRGKDIEPKLATLLSEIG
ncbi:MAG: DUF262 domain-containing protein [Leptospira sp.]|jgi:hypothetical protein|nr:DUF262 domain-containing protein [Leptospira sp.]